MIPRGMPRKMKTAQAPRRARPFAGFMSRAYRSHARAGMWRLLMVPIRNVETRRELNKAHGENIKDNNWTRITGWSSRYIGAGSGDSQTRDRKLSNVRPLRPRGKRSVQ